jgi:hypothetical protein
MSTEGQRELDKAFDGLERLASGRVARAIRWLRSPQSKWVRIPLGIVFIVAALLGPILPVVGLELLPIGLMLVAQDVPFLKKPVARMMLWLERKWSSWKKRREAKKARREGRTQVHA